MARLQSKFAIVTGAAQGIGKSIAEAFAAEGAQVILTDIQGELVEQVASKLGKSHFAFEMDVGSESDWLKLEDFTRAKFGKLNILVNNAGIIGFDHSKASLDPEHSSLESWQNVHRVNLDGCYLGCRSGIRLMKDSPAASIINISSRSGLVGIPTAVAYASSKAGMRNHSKSVALYCADKGYKIRSNSLHPGAILTAIWEPMFGTDREKAIREISNGIPVGRMGKPEEVASLCIYLASDESLYVTGAEFILDGGILAGSSAAPKAR